MIKDKQKDIIDKLDNTEEIKRFKELEKQIKSNKKYNSLMEEFNKKNNPSNEEIIKLRQELFKIDGVKEYLSLEKDVRLFSKKTSDIISSIVNTENCK